MDLSVHWCFGLTLLWLAYLGDCANTTVRCMQEACLGHSFYITCQISGSIGTSLSWTRPDALDVLLCNSDRSKCPQVVGNKGDYKLVKNDSAEMILQVKNFSQSDAGSWSCSDGVSAINNKCTVAARDSPSANITASCKETENKNLVVMCGTIDYYGSPPVNLTVMVDGKLYATLDQGNTGIILPKDLGGSTVTCQLVGGAAQCLSTYKPSHVVCPGFPVNMAMVIGLAVGGGVILIIIIGCFIYRKRKSGSSRLSGSDSDEEDDDEKNVTPVSIVAVDKEESEETDRLARPEEIE